MAKPEVKHRGVFERVKGSGEWWINYHDAEGRRHREKVGSKGNAIKLRDKRRAEALAGKKLPELNRKKVSFGDLLDLAVKYAEEHGTPSLIRNFKIKAELARPALGSMALERVTRDVLFEWIAERGVEPATFNKYRSFFSAGYREAMIRGLTDRNVARLMRAKKVPGGRYRFLTRAEYDRVVAAITARCPSRLPRFLVAVNTGMRLTEQFTLEWQQVDWHRGEIHLLKTKNGSQRDIPMNKVVRDALRAIQPLNAEGRVFPLKRKAKGAEQVTVHLAQRKWFENVLTDAKVKGVTWHTLRHTFCSWLVMAGVDLPTVQKWMGHKHITMTMRYSHLAPGHNNSEIERIAG
jgi:integrase